MNNMEYAEYIKEFAKQELNIVANSAKYKSPNQTTINNSIYMLVDRLSEIIKANPELEAKDIQHIIGGFCRLANRNPILPLTGDVSEWNEHDNDGICVNKRFENIYFDMNDGTAYHKHARAFSPDRGHSWIYNAPECDAKIEFPYRVNGKPKRIYLSNGETPEAWVAKNVEKGRIIG